jgi:hypothetical protein
MASVPKTIQELVRREFLDLLRCSELSAVSRSPTAHLRQIAATDKQTDVLIMSYAG